MIENPKQMGRYWALSQCGFEMVAPCIGGVFLDNWLGTMPVFTIILLVLGFIGGLAHIVILSNQIAKAEEEERKAKNGTDKT